MYGVTGSWLVTLLCTTLLTAADTAGIRQLIERGSIEDALKQIEELEKEQPDNPTIQLEIGEILQALAASRAERLRRGAPDSAQAHELIGKSYEAHQKLNEALREYKAAAEKEPRLAGVHFLIGNVYWKLGDLVSARDALKSELALNPSDSLANLRMGQVLLRMDENLPEAAIPYLRRAIDDPQTSLPAHRELG